MFYYKAFAVLVLASLANVNGFPLEERKMDGRIVGGNDTEIRVLPYQVSIMVKGFPFCGGSIISPEWVLTAAHCVPYLLPELSVRVGSDYSMKGGAVHRVDRYINHKNFSLTTGEFPVNDISLIHLKEPIEMDDTKKPIPLFEEGDIAAAGSFAVVSGWGTTTINGPFSVKLQAVLLPIVSTEVCAKAYAYKGKLPKNQICAGYPEGGKDSCLGDSGGPLAIDGRLAGIVSWGYDCGVPNMPGVYTEVAKYRDWIRDNSGL